MIHFGLNEFVDMDIDNDLSDLELFSSVTTAKI